MEVVPTTATSAEPSVVKAKKGGLEAPKKKTVEAPTTNAEMENKSGNIKYLPQLNKPKNPSFVESTLSAQFE